MNYLGVLLAKLHMRTRSFAQKYGSRVMSSTANCSILPNIFIPRYFGPNLSSFLRKFERLLVVFVNDDNVSIVLRHE